HVDGESERLEGMMAARRARQEAVESLRDSLKFLKSTLGTAPAREWVASEQLASNAEHLDALNPSSLRCSEDELQGIEANLLPVIARAVGSAKNILPAIRELSSDAHF